MEEGGHSLERGGGGMALAACSLAAMLAIV